jgi:eukaryotic-like serine/threonine-protein kinase
MRLPDDQDASGLEGQTLGRRFLVRRLIGEGGMGAVYEVEHVVTKRAGALKLLHPGLASSSDIAERFLLEASAAGRIGNPHIVETFDAGELPSGELYIFMELLSGRPLRDLLLERGRIPFAEARELILQVADGLAAAHEAKIVHRDVKPDNLFLCAGPRPFVKILDFGISKFAEQHSVKRLTAQGATLGTPHYMSPEQVVSKPDIDDRVDVYALGVVLYECLTGKVPFDAETLTALSIKIFEGHYTPVSELVSGAPAALDGLLERALAREPNRRFSSVRELADALDDLAAPSSRQSASAPGKDEGVDARTERSELLSRTQVIPQPNRSGDSTGRQDGFAASQPPALAAQGVTPLDGRGEAPRHRSSLLWAWGALAMLGAGASGAAMLRGAEAPGDPAQPAVSAPAIEVPSADSLALPAPSITGKSAAEASPTPTSPTSTAPSSSGSRSLRGKAAPSSSAPRSRAAADGLTERNPFAD